MDAYREIIKNVYKNGFDKPDPNRDGVMRRSINGVRFEHDMEGGFPALTGKRLYFKGVVEELLWFLRGLTNVKHLIREGVNIWNKDTYNFQKTHHNINKEDGSEYTLEEWVELVKKGDDEVSGYAGRIYGSQLRYFGEALFDQLHHCIKELDNNHFSSSNLVTFWNPEEIYDDGHFLALKPCHYSFQLLGAPNNKVDMVVNIRSWDLFLGAPFNIASYGLLLKILCQLTAKRAGKLIINAGDAHIYHDHLEAVDEYLNRPLTKLPLLEINSEMLNSQWDDVTQAIRMIESMEFEDFKLVGYSPAPPIRAEMLAYTVKNEEE